MSQPSKGLVRNGLGLRGSIALGLSSTAPVYSLAATLGFIVLAAGEQTPAALIIAFIPMLLIAFAYRELNRDEPECGTTYTWAARTLGRRTGWMGGWALALSGVFVLANLAQVAGQYFWTLISPELSESTVVVTATGLGFIALMTWVNVRGIRAGSTVQKLLGAVQACALGMFVISMAVKLMTGDAPAPTAVEASWFNPAAFDSVQSMTQAVLLALFIYWGWDTCLALSEETRDPARTPGKAAVISASLLVGIYTGVSVLAMMFAGTGTDGTGLGNEDNAGDVFYALAEEAMGPWAWIVIIAVLVSVVSSTQTTILPTARGTLSMALQGALPARFGTVDPRYGTPVFSTVIMGVVSAGYYAGMTLISEDMLGDSIASLGLMIAFYYGVTGLTCVVRFRSELGTSARNLWFKGILPAAGALAMMTAFAISAVDMFDRGYGATTIFGIGGTFVIGVGSLAAGVPIMELWHRHRDRKLKNGPPAGPEPQQEQPEDTVTAGV